MTSVPIRRDQKAVLCSVDEEATAENPSFYHETHIELPRHQGGYWVDSDAVVNLGEIIAALRETRQFVTLNLVAIQPLKRRDMLARLDAILARYREEP